MAYMKFKEPVVIYGSGIYVPEKEVDFNSLESQLKGFDNSRGNYESFCRKHFGSKTIHESSAEQYTSDLMAIAGEKAIFDSGILKKDIGAVVMATITPDDRIAGVRSFVLEKLGLYDIESHELRIACSSVLSAVRMGYSVVSGTNKYVLLIGGDVTRSGKNHTKSIVRHDDLMYTGLIGDGAAAVVIGPGEEGYGFRDSFFATNFAWKDDAKEGEDGHFSMVGKSLKERVGPLFIKYVKDAIRSNNYNQESVVVALHQVNGALLQAVAETLSKDPEIKIDPSRVINVFQNYGNVVAGSMFVALHHALKSGFVRRDTSIIGAGVGAGFDHGWYSYKADRDLPNKKLVRMLIVDDESRAAEMLKDALEACLENDSKYHQRTDFRIDIAFDANSAAKKALEKRYDLFVIDQRMPKETGGKGTDLVDRLKELESQEIKAVIHSGASTEDDKKLMVSNPSILAYIEKPFMLTGYDLKEQPNWIKIKEIIDQI